MLDLNLVNGRYFKVKVSDIELSLKPCKLKTIRKFQKMSKNAETEEDIIDIVSIVLNNNKTNYKVTDEIIEELNTDQMNELLFEYFDWIAREKTQNPN